VASSILLEATKQRILGSPQQIGKPSRWIHPCVKHVLTTSQYVSPVSCPRVSTVECGRLPTEQCFEVAVPLLPHPKVTRCVVSSPYQPRSNKIIVPRIFGNAG
jgi:hypothetical protein